jgi:hypothetical protein
MQDTPETDPPEAALPPHLRLLRNLVTVLTGTMILGVIAIVALLVIRLNAPAAPVVIDPGAFAVPEGTRIVGYSHVGDAAVLVGAGGTIWVFDRATGDLRQEFRIGE